MAVYPFILINDEQLKNDKVLIRHEVIHLYQQLELLIIPFYIAYLFNYLLNRLKYKTHNEAYQKIVFEKEAYLNERNEAYLRLRRFWAWLAYV